MNGHSTLRGLGLDGPIPLRVFDDEERGHLSGFVCPNIRDVQSGEFTKPCPREQREQRQPKRCFTMTSARPRALRVNWRAEQPCQIIELEWCTLRFLLWQATALKRIVLRGVIWNVA